MSSRKKTTSASEFKKHKMAFLTFVRYLTINQIRKVNTIISEILNKHIKYGEIIKSPDLPKEDYEEFINKLPSVFRKDFEDYELTNKYYKMFLVMRAYYIINLNKSQFKNKNKFFELLPLPLYKAHKSKKPLVRFYDGLIVACNTQLLMESGYTKLIDAQYKFEYYYNRRSKHKVFLEFVFSMPGYWREIDEQTARSKYPEYISYFDNPEGRPPIKEHSDRPYLYIVESKIRSYVRGKAIEYANNLKIEEPMEIDFPTLDPMEIFNAIGLELEISAPEIIQDLTEYCIYAYNKSLKDALFSKAITLNPKIAPLHISVAALEKNKIKVYMIE
ncbi:MAG: hypothetical protein QW255_04520 [Candidatus Bilamarchaeaceae archaeon]